MTSNAQEKNLTWIQNLGGSDNEEANRLLPTNDGGILLSGYSYSNDGMLSGNNGWQDGWLIKTNANGHLEWQTTIGGNGADVIEAIEEVNDGYILAGWSSSTEVDFINSNGLEDGFIAKIDFKGNVQWIESFGGSSMDKLFDLEITEDGDIVAVGYLMSPNVSMTTYQHHGLLDLWVVKLDQDGQLIWQNTYGGSDDDFAYAITTMSDGTFAIAGSSDSMDGQVGGNNGEWDGWIINIDNDGKLLWSESFGHEGNDKIQEVIIYQNEIYAIGSSNSSSLPDHHGKYDAWVVHFSENGVLLDEFNYGSPGKDLIHGAISTPNGIYVTGESENGYSRDGWIIQLDGMGEVLSSQLVGGSEADVLYDITYKGDDIYLAGASASNDGDMNQNFGQTDALFAKLGGESSVTDNIKAFPNPASNSITIVLDQIGIETITIYNALGQVTYSSMANNFFQEQVDITDWTPGYYTIEVKTNDEIRRTQFIKE
jgi:hypothetical protein